MRGLLRRGGLAGVEGAVGEGPFPVQELDDRGVVLRRVPTRPATIPP